MSDAIATPTRRARREQDSNQFAIPQPEDIIMPRDGRLERPENIVSSEGGIDKDYIDALVFAEEPVSLILQESGEENAPTVQECWVNGRGIEFLTDEGKWRINWPGLNEGFAPIGISFTTKRKYVEILLKKRSDKVRTVHDDASVAYPVNTVKRHTAHMAPLSIIEDKNPKGPEWLRRIMREA